MIRRALLESGTLMLRLSLALTLATLLSGCMTSEDRAAAVIAADDDQCRSYGAQPWTPAYVRCRLAISERRQESAAFLAGVTLGQAPPPDGPLVLMAPPTPIVVGPQPLHARY